MNKFVLAGLFCLLATPLWAYSESDSLRAELKRIELRLQEIENRSEQREDSLERVEDSIELAVERAIDTKEKQLDSSSQETVSISEAQQLLQKINDKITRGNSHGFGGSGGIVTGASYISMKPIKDLMSSDLKINGAASTIYGFDLSQRMGNREVMAMVGGIGMGGIGNGVRIGGAGINNMNTFSSRKGDTLATLELEVSYGGVIVAKQFSHEKHHLTLSGLFGAGSMDYRIYKNTDKTGSGLFSSTAVKDSPFGNEVSKGESSFYATELNGAYTYSFARLFHVGVDMGGFMQYSRNGFNGTDNYMAFNPFGRVRLLFGRLG